MRRDRRADLMVNRGIPLRELLIQQVVLLDAVQLALRVPIVLRAIPQLLRQLRHQQLLRNRLVVVAEQRSTVSSPSFSLQPQRQQQILARRELQPSCLAIAALDRCWVQRRLQRSLERTRERVHHVGVRRIRIERSASKPEPIRTWKRPCDSDRKETRGPGQAFRRRTRR